ncbi:Ku protein [Saccharopolyspora taberi]|uniref:Non-homologous end joining protein Ku n=1 Tax=Saccharopolyspora taberi TaxID=60895 RepID=A0ABN3VKN8_9PSEU
MASVWQGAISFGLVNIAVRLHPAVSGETATFRQIHRDDGGRIRHKRVCEQDGREVDLSQIDRAYEAGGLLVPLTDEDLDHLPLPTHRQIEVLQFVAAKEIAPVHLGRAYYVEPHPVLGAERAYVLLRDTMAETDRIALTRVAIRQREHLAMLRPDANLLVLQLLHWPESIRDPSPLAPPPGVTARPEEKQMARTLIDSLTGHYHPEDYRDRYREALESLVDAKLTGRELEEAPSAPPSIDLIDALNASISQVKASTHKLTDS